jgi:inward rectifier potassium channel
MQKQTIDPGLGEKYFQKTKRIINNDGSFNVTKIGAGFNYKDIYQYLINISWIKFFLIVLSVYIFLNFVFAFLYYLIGVEDLAGTAGNNLNNFLDAFFFSAQTLTTVGYGGMSPKGLLVNIISAFEAMSGLMCFALITGLLYGRFSRPSARILFSQNALIAPYREIKSLQFRIANQRHNTLMEIEARVLLVFVEKSGDQYNRKYFELKLERNSVYFFPLTWTIVHPIDEDSPFYGKTETEIKLFESEILILIKGFDDTFSQVVHSRYSYTSDEIIWNAKFIRAFNNEQNGDIVFNIDDIHKYELV